MDKLLEKDENAWGDPADSSSKVWVFPVHVPDLWIKKFLRWLQPQLMPVFNCKGAKQGLPSLVQTAPRAMRNNDIKVLILPLSLVYIIA